MEEPIFSFRSIEISFPVVATASLPAGVIGTPYSFQLTATGGTPPYRWSGLTLPSWMTLSSGGLLTGTPIGISSVLSTDSGLVIVTDQNAEILVTPVGTSLQPVSVQVYDATQAVSLPATLQLLIT